MVEEQGVALKVGDILLIRSGYVKWHDNASHEERLEGAKKLMFGGVESTMEAVEWIWNHHFSAVAGDSPAWEAMPPKGDFYLVYPLVLKANLSMTICWRCGELHLVRCLIVRSWRSFARSRNDILSSLLQPHSILSTESPRHQMPFASSSQRDQDSVIGRLNIYANFTLRIFNASGIILV